MDFNLAELIAHDQQPESLLQQTRNRWPMNARAVALTHSDDTDRVRLRRVLQQLQEWDITASGIEPAHQQDDTLVIFVGAYDQRGTLKEKLEVVVTDASLLDQVQMALQQHGWPAVVDHKDHLHVLRGVPSEHHVKFAELDLVDGGRGEIAPERAEQWLAACGQLDQYARVLRAEETELEPDQLAPWLAIQGEDDRSLLARAPDLAGDWVRAEIPLAEGERWIRASRRLQDYRTAKRWMSAGWQAHEAAAWINLLSWTAEAKAVQELEDDGYTVKHALRLHAAGVDSFDFRTLRRQKMSPGETVAWLEAGVDSVWALKPWRELGLDGYEVRRWQRAAKRGGLSRPVKASEVKPWTDAGQGINEAEPWLRLHHGFLKRELVEEWQAEGLGPAEAAEWGRAGVPSLSEVRRWQRLHSVLGNPQQVARLVKAKISPAQAALMLQALATSD